MLTRRSILALGAAPALAGTSAFAQDKPIHVLLGYPAGGPTDLLARLVAQALNKALGQPAIVENQPGALGSIAARAAMRAAPDGQTVLVCTSQSHGTNPTLLKNAGYDPLRDFSSIVGLADIQQVLVVRNGLPVNSVRELIAYAKANPGKLNYASTGSGAGAHLAMEMFKLKTGVDLVHIPFKGAAQMTPEIVAGRIDATFATVPSVLGQLRAKTMRGLAVASLKPAPQLPELPLLKDEGVQGCEADSWSGLVGPAGMPPALVARYMQIVTDAFKDPVTEQAVLNAGMLPNTRSAAEFKAYMGDEIARWATVIRAANITIDAN